MLTIRVSLALLAFPGLALVIVALAPTAGAAGPRSLRGVGSNERLDFMSQAVSIHAWAKDPSSAPTGALRSRFRAIKEAKAAAAKARGSARARRAARARSATVLGNIVFNRDALGLPQNEESVTTCSSDATKVLGGTNDYRGLLLPGFTGWHYSATGGTTRAKEGGLPDLAG